MIQHKGLNPEQIEKSREEHGSNSLTPAPKTPLWKLFVEKFSDPVIRILLVAAFLSLGIAFVPDDNGDYHFYETIGIFCAILLATGIAFWFEVDAARKFDILNQVNDDSPVRVIRDGQVREVGKRDIVVGDIILLDTGDEIPADAELLESVSMQVNESNLTGEPSTSKSIHPEDFKKDSTYAGNLVLRGTTVIEGHGMAQVIRVGDSTEFGKVARQSTVKSEEITPLNRQLERLAKLIGVIGFTLALITFLSLFFKDIFLGPEDFTLGQIGLLGAVLLGAAVALVKVWMPIVYDGFYLAGKSKKIPVSFEKRGWLVWLALGILTFVAVTAIGFLFGVNPLNSDSWISVEEARNILSYFMVAVTLIVVAVPEGLPMSVTLSLALSIRKMLKANNLVRKMHACETMGAATVICTDKTGTLTKNQMSVNVTHFKFGLPDSIVYEGIAVNTTANLNKDDVNHPRPLGNPTEGALLLWLDALPERVDYAALRQTSTMVAQLPFSTRHKYMATIVRSSTDEFAGQTMLYVKGAPEVVLGFSTSLSGDQRSEVETQLLGYQNKAMRTLAFAYRTLPADVDYGHYDSEQMMALVGGGCLTFAGYTAIMDPVRDDVPSAVVECMAAGIEIKIVTGDTPGTAREIGRQIGLWDSETDGAENEISGLEWEALSDEEALERVGEIKIMSRARPMDKQRLVQMLQRKGEVVAVTGDGTNDAPALNFANVGLSMGSGTSVAKEASDITLLDDSFSSIATAVMWGRSVYRNIQRFVLFQLTINVAALTIVFMGSLLGFDLPLTVTQMLWVNLIMDTFAAGALASIPPDKGEMNRAPRRASDFIITPFMKSSILWTGFIFVAIMLVLLWFFKQAGGGEVSRYSESMFFTIFVMLQFWNMFNAKAYASGHSAFHELSKNVGFLIVGMLIVVGQVLIVSFGGDVFRVVPLAFVDWVIIIVSTSAVLWIGELIRFVKSRSAAK